VHKAVLAWAGRLMNKYADIERVGYFGSYARGDWGVGSDLDLIIIVTDSNLPFYGRAVDISTSELPVPSDVLVYTWAEWDEMADVNGKFFQVIQKEIIWIN